MSIHLSLPQAASRQWPHQAAQAWSCVSEVPCPAMGNSEGSWALGHGVTQEGRGTVITISPALLALPSYTIGQGADITFTASFAPSPTPSPGVHVYPRHTHLPPFPCSGLEVC